VPQKYFDKFPLKSVKLPVGYKENDLDDLPPAGQRIGRNRYFKHIRSQHQWRQGVQGYLASINYADTMLGRVLDSLENGPNKDNTIIVLWSDHGWHLGEKQHWQKYTGWRACTRVGKSIPLGKGEYGNAILSKHTILKQLLHRLPSQGEARTALEIQCHVGKENTASDHRPIFGIIQLKK